LMVLGGTLTFLVVWGGRLTQLVVLKDIDNWVVV
jgi:hypothetical protein